MNIAEILRSPVLKNICKWLLLSDGFYMISASVMKGLSNLAFAPTILLKFLFQNENIKIISSRESQKQIFYNPHIPYIMFI